MYAWGAYLCPPMHMCLRITSCKTTLICINTNLHEKLPPVAPNVNALVFIVFWLQYQPIHAIPCHSMYISMFQQIAKIYDMLNINSLGLLKKGAAKQSRIKNTRKSKGSACG